MNPRSLHCLVPLILLAGAGALAAQESEVARLHARLSEVRDTAELRRLERAHEPSGTAEDQLAAGFAALQLWLVTGERKHAERSRRHFDRAAEQDPTNAWAHYGHALSFEPDVGGGPGFIATDDAIGRALGLDARSRARRALERAVALDPSLSGAAELLGRYAAATWDASASQLALRALTDAARDPTVGTDVLLALARTARAQGDYLAAAAAADRAVARADSSYASASLELTRALAGLEDREADAAAAYLEVLAHAGDALLTRLWDDVALIRRESDRSRWEGAPTTEARRTVLRSFWEVRGALSGKDAEERAAEHYRRLNYAWLHHRRWGELGAAPANAYHFQKLDPLYADRGIIYIRHGEPTHVWRSAPGDYVVWFYRDQQGSPLSYHFIRYGGNAGWSRDLILVRRLPCVDPDLALHDARLRPLVYGCNSMRIEVVSARVRSDVGRALRTDSDAPRFAHDVPFHYDLYSFRGPAGTTELVAGVGVPLAGLRESDRLLEFSLALADTARYTATSAHTSVTAPAPPLAAAALLRLQLGVRVAPAAAAAYRIGVQTAGGGGGGIYGGTINVPDYRGEPLQMSDVVLAEPDSLGSFVRGPHRLALAPTQVFPGGRFQVFYEVYNLLAVAPYRTEIRIERARRGLLSRLLGGGEPVALRFDEVAPDPVAATHYQLRDVTAPLEPGDYLLHVRVRTGAAEVERTRRFTVPEPPR